MRRWVGLIATLMLITGLAGAPAASARRTGPRAQAAATAPTLGVRTQRYTEGFGRVRPSNISYGGDPTSMVGDVHWSSWGGARAVGHGEAGWTWPGFCVACGTVQLPATVVAFGLRRCGGHPAYADVEWYFPSRGMTFSPHLTDVNICDPEAVTHVTEPPLIKCAPVQIPGARVDRIEVNGYDIRCPTAHAAIPDLGLISHYHHTARFHVGVWWCGTDLSMQTTPVPPQSFTCETGDYDWLDFDLSPTSDVIRP